MSRLKRLRVMKTRRFPKEGMRTIAYASTRIGRIFGISIIEFFQGWVAKNPGRFFPQNIEVPSFLFRGGRKARDAL